MTHRAADHLAEHLRRTVTGPMWHGPALGELLDGITLDQAMAHPVPGAHSIGELILHVTTWARIASERVDGSSREVTAAEDWPGTAGMDAAAWVTAKGAMLQAYEQLARRAGTLADEALDAVVPNGKQTYRVLLHGVIEHGTYHAGQVAMLKRALQAP